MSIQYCEECDRFIDTDFDAEHEHFEEHEIEKHLEEGNGMAILSKFD